MVLSTASVTDLIAGLSPYSDFKKQLLGAAVGLPLMWMAARSSPRLFRAFAYPLLAIAVVGLALTLIRGVGVSEIIRIAPQHAHSMRRNQLGNARSGWSRASAGVGSWRGVLPRVG